MIAQPDGMAAAATDLAGIGSTLTRAHSAAELAATADSVSSPADQWAAMAAMAT